ncbi:bifunctional diaminohydroxyphosphoribosylaminopyrimidine deaminase/5-amino-6-(5-phosphoribosylamino)uracil reductase RibD [Rhodovulum sp. DZ06]|uniref:bifunctional diaminohydroxyphosphoribosylaminopyrimidine deaminase/5-amino-6-(5-phosphoribosylamino)uracil reductase RibD n=1 Tax=Rhodovulum sp. DZ06 TaxID=3425126 RepID=UPI003D329BBE
MTGSAAPRAEDARHMAHALSLAARGLGRVAPNPAVGCVIVARGRVVGRGWTQPGGRPHAETMALAQAGAAARGATAYVTLEPCAHHGRTPPCCDALIAAGVARVVCPLQDPDPRVSGRGFGRLRDAGVAVEIGLMAAEAEAAQVGFLTRLRRGRPHLTLKLGASLDGRIALASGESQWITGPEARAEAHLLRARSDAILVGSGAAVADDPALTCRLPGLEDRSPDPVVFDGRARLSPDTQLARTAAARRALLLHAPDADPVRVGALKAAGMTCAALPRGADGMLDLAEGLSLLGARGVTRAMCEGGGMLAAALLKADLVDELWWCAAGMALGAESRPGIGDLGLARLADAPRFTLVEHRRLGADVLCRWARAGA